MDKKTAQGALKGRRAARRATAPRGADKGAKPTVNDLIRLAKREFLSCRRIDVKQLAEELGVGRATAFRWIGDRETLYGHVCATLFTSTFDLNDRQLTGEGLTRNLALLQRVFEQVASHPAIAHFIASDPSFAMRVVSDGPSYQRGTALIQSLLERTPSELDPVVSSTELASTVVILANAFMVGCAFGGRQSDVTSMMNIVRAVLTTGHANPTPLPVKVSSPGRKRPLA